MPDKTTRRHKALFLDRDGVINEDYGYVHKKEDFVFVEGIFQLVSAAKEKGYLVIIVTNQAGIGRGYYSEGDFVRLMDWVRQRFAEKGGAIDAVFHCPFHPTHGVGKYKQKSFFRKPAPGMLLQAANDYGLHLPSSVLVGDSRSDIQAGLAAGVGKLFFYAHEGDPVPGAQSVTYLRDILPAL